LGGGAIFPFRVRIRKWARNLLLGMKIEKISTPALGLKVKFTDIDLSLRKIDEERLQLAEGLAKNDFLRRLIMRRRREPWLTVDRTKSRNRASRFMGTLR